ncbi:MAG: hypothetical protein A3F41_00620 [Coxiella sp. RIFCSPHIGHO2_12_FULL_44_14]|nr:MAG: hypothetical protein A3F41_00620 [Coxiella sp. RIFCSPHIGHO2_12_FULL_44_14]
MPKRTHNQDEQEKDESQKDSKKNKDDKKNIILNIRRSTNNNNNTFDTHSDQKTQRNRVLTEVQALYRHMSRVGQEGLAPDPARFPTEPPSPPKQSGGKFPLPSAPSLLGYGELWSETVGFWQNKTQHSSLVSSPQCVVCGNPVEDYTSTNPVPENPEPSLAASAAQQGGSPTTWDEPEAKREETDQDSDQESVTDILAAELSTDSDVLLVSEHSESEGTDFPLNDHFNVGGPHLPADAPPSPKKGG